MIVYYLVYFLIALVITLLSLYKEKKAFIILPTLFGAIIIVQNLGFLLDFSENFFDLDEKNFAD